MAVVGYNCMVLIVWLLLSFAAPSFGTSPAHTKSQSLLTTSATTNKEEIAATLLENTTATSPTKEEEEEQHHRDNYHEFSCDHLYKYASHHNRAKQCLYAQTCNQGEGIFTPIIYCSTRHSTTFWVVVLTPFLVLLLIVLFRMVGSTAEDFFCPPLELISLKLGLPSRFAGVTLLALGNGAPDIAATVNAIRNDAQVGYLMALGELTGSGMFIGTVITGVVVVVASTHDTNGVSCPPALIRDVLVFFVTLVVVYYKFAIGGTIGKADILLFWSLYLAYVLLVLATDVYHRRQRPTQQHHHHHCHHSSSSLSQESTSHHHETAVTPQPRENDGVVVVVASETTSLLRGSNHTSPNHQTSTASNGESHPKQELHVSESNDYSTCDENGDEQLIVVHLSHGGVRNVPYNKHHHHSRTSSSRSLGSQAEAIIFRPPSVTATIATLEDENANALAKECDKEEDEIVFSSSWASVWVETKHELLHHLVTEWNDIYNNDQRHTITKVLLTLELPFTILRQLTVPIPCDEYYCRSLVALSTTLSPFLIRYYFLSGNDVDIFTAYYCYGIPAGILWVCIPLLLGLLTLRFAPSAKGPMRLYLSTPLSIYGFFVSALWIDMIADKLVDVLSVLGIVFRIPGPIMGLSVLAVGNSIGDLSANVAVAKKGLANMAITACFAGPVFNFLVGLALGFSALQGMTGLEDIPVKLPASLVTGFLFSCINCLLIVVLGLCWGGRLKKEYGYAALILYTAYAVSSVLV